MIQPPDRLAAALADRHVRLASYDRHLGAAAEALGIASSPL